MRKCKPKTVGSPCRIVRGWGVGTEMHSSGAYPGIKEQANAVLKMNEDGTVHLLTGNTDLGTGARTALAQIALRQLLTGQGSFVLPRPPLELATAGHSFDLEGNLHDEAIRERVAGFIEALAAWARRLRPD
ncbi:MAG: molybdopterin-dependent oxidoreductase [Planctomycetes bacterium]|nr:molybdopterin-dependent oxidoreductase [Planctomycetota bacterium]